MWTKEVPTNTGLYWTWYPPEQAVSVASVYMDGSVLMVALGAIGSNQQLKLRSNELLNRGVWFHPANVPCPPVNGV